MNYSAYFAEIYRSGIQSIPRGQYEAAEILGYSKAQTFLRIIFPQVFKRIVPALGNEVIVLVKDTSLAFTIGVAEMFTTARAIVSAARHAHGFRGGGTVLLGVYLRGRIRHLAHRKAPGLLSRLSEKGTWYD